jgi:UDP-N-acetyl-D-galactosamine dehydrogenase
MGKLVAEQCVKLLSRQGLSVAGAAVGILGFTFKENVPDTRNTRVAGIARELEEYGARVLAHDPLADPVEVAGEYGLQLLPPDALRDLDALILAVPHEAFRKLSLESLAGRFKKGGRVLLLDIKNFWNRDKALALGYNYWSL